MRRYAELQIAAAPLVDELRRAGTPDVRLLESAEQLFPLVRSETAQRLRGDLPRVQQLLGRLEASPLPMTIEHGDLHDANVFVRGGHVRILDWGDANVAHPFLSLTVEMDPDARGSYLEPWTAFAPIAELEREAALVVDLRYLLRAIAWLKVVPYDESAAAGIDDRVNWFFDGLPGDGT
jgi:Ser/Thr protein kinase RdoA (MazF antagonist)